MTSFGSWVKDERVARRLSMAECSRKGGTYIQNWNRIEKIRARPEMTTMIAVSRAFDVPIAEVAARAGYELEWHFATYLGMRLARILHDLPEEARQTIESLLEHDARQYKSLLTREQMPAAA